MAQDSKSFRTVQASNQYEPHHNVDVTVYVEAASKTYVLWASDIQLNTLAQKIIFTDALGTVEVFDFLGLERTNNDQDITVLVYMREDSNGHPHLLRVYND